MPPSPCSLLSHTYRHVVPWTLDVSAPQARHDRFAALEPQVPTRAHPREPGRKAKVLALPRHTASPRRRRAGLPGPAHATPVDLAIAACSPSWPTRSGPAGAPPELASTLYLARIAGGHLVVVALSLALLTAIMTHALAHECASTAFRRATRVRLPHTHPSLLTHAHAKTTPDLAGATPDPGNH